MGGVFSSNLRSNLWIDCTCCVFGSSLWVLFSYLWAEFTRRVYESSLLVEFRFDFSSRVYESRL